MKKDMRKDSDFFSFHGALLSMLKRYGLGEKYDQYRLQRDWAQVAGTVVAERTTKLSLHRKKLYITLSSSPLRYELQTRKKQLLARVIEHLELGYIEDIVIT